MVSIGAELLIDSTVFLTYYRHILHQILLYW